MGKYFISNKVGEAERASGAGEAENITYSRKQTKKIIKNKLTVKGSRVGTKSFQRNDL